METRQFNQFENLSAEETRETLAEGLGLIVEHVEDLQAKANRIEDDAPRLAEIARTLAKEEAGKAFVLIDYLRPTAEISDGERSSHLAYAADHMARLVYVRYYGTRPASFEEATRIIERNRRSHYLEGPEAVEWVFRNRMIDEREKLLYVDYVEREGETEWRSPVGAAERMLETGTLVSRFSPWSSDLLLAMNESGLLEPEPLRLLGETWEEVELTPEFRWGDCLQLNRDWLESCHEADVISPDAEEGQLGLILDRFLFPLCGLDLRRNDVLDEMRERQERARQNYRRFI